MFKILQTLTTLVLLVQGVAFAQKANLDQVSRVGIVDSERIFKESNMAKESQKKLQAEFGKREKLLGDEAAKIKAESANLNKKNSKLSAAEKSKKSRDLVERDRLLQVKHTEYLEDWKQRRFEERSKIAQKANGALQTVAEKKNIDLILQDFAYGSKAIDLTDDVIGVLNLNR